MKHKNLIKIVKYMMLCLGAFLSYLIGRVTGIFQNTKQVQVIMVLLLISTLMVLIYRYKIEKLTTKEIAIAIIFAGLIMRIGYMVYTNCDVRSHDLWGFSAESGGHAGYILTLIETGHLPKSNFLQYYQQPLYYILGSFISKVANRILSSNEAYYLVDAAKIISCMASCLVLLLTEELCQICNLEGKTKLITLALVAFLPDFYLTGGRINPDALATFFMVAALRYTLSWYGDPSWKDTLVLAIIYGFGMMTKISCGVVAIFTAFLFFSKLVQSIKEKQEKVLILKSIVFALISLPLGLWYSVRNYILFKQPFNYVLWIGEDSEIYTGGYSIVERLFGIDILNLLRSPYTDVYSDYNAPVYYLKSALFGEFIYEIPKWIPMLLLLFTGVLAVIVLEAIIWQFYKGSRDQYGKFLAGLSCLCYGSMLVFYLSYPFGCSMDYRYMLFLTIPISIILGKYYEQHKNTWKRELVVGCLGGYVICSCIMYVMIA